MMYFSISINLVLLVALFFIGAKCIESRRAKSALQKLMDYTHTGYYKYRFRDGVIIETNKNFIDILELDMEKEEAIGRSLSELIIYVSDEESIRKRVREEKEIKNHRYRFKTLKGRDKCVLYNSFISRDPGTGEEVIEAVVKDITDERYAYTKIKETEERYKKLFKSSGDIVVIYKFETEAIEEINPVTEILTGFSEDELTGRSFEVLFHPSSRKSLNEAHKDLMFRGSSRFEGVIVCKNGSYKEVSVTLSMFEFKDERIVMAVVKDISGLVRGREEETRRKEELEKFWKASVEREQRLKDLRTELQVAKQQIKLLEGKKQD
ncbi:MAG: PAS domain-containing protein [Candidatus Omnitrophota bacterium]|jgi:PAS domain S-box-containing protein